MMSESLIARPPIFLGLLVTGFAIGLFIGDTVHSRRTRHESWLEDMSRPAAVLLKDSLRLRQIATHEVSRGTQVAFTDGDLRTEYNGGAFFRLEDRRVVIDGHDLGTPAEDVLLAIEVQPDECNVINMALGAHPALNVPAADDGVLYAAGVQGCAAEANGHHVFYTVLEVH